jgi:hypothetical protein
MKPRIWTRPPPLVWLSDPEWEALKKLDLEPDYAETRHRVNQLLDLLGEHLAATQSDHVKTLLPFALVRNLAFEMAQESADDDEETIESTRALLREALDEGWADGLTAARKR